MGAVAGAACGAGDLGSARAISTGLAGVRVERVAGGRALPVLTAGACAAGGCGAAEKSSRAVSCFWGAAWPNIRQAVQQESANPRVGGIVGCPVRVDRPPSCYNDI